MAQLITNVTLIDADQVMPNAAIEIRDGRIGRIGELSDFGNDPPMETVDGHGSWLLPGLIDPHVHLSLDMTPECLVTPRDPNDPVLWETACRNGRALLNAGVTTAADCGSPGDLGLRLRDAFDSGLEAGPRLLVSGPAITVAGGHGAWFGRAAGDRREVVTAARELLQMGVDFLKVMASGGGMPGTVAPWEACYSRDTLRALVDHAEHAGVRVVAHARAAAAIARSVSAGIHRIEHVTWEVGRGTVAFDPDVVRQMIRAGTWVDPTLPAGRRAMTSPIITASRREELRHAFIQRDPNYRRMALQGLHLLAGTDAGTPLVGFDDFARGPELLVKLCDYSPHDAIRAATAWAAEALGIGDRVGRLRSGMVADLLVLDGDPMSDISALREVSGVVKGGHWIERKEADRIDPAAGSSES